MRAIRDRLRQLYGRPINEPHQDPVAELVRTILSQHTNDTNRDVAYERLRERLPAWSDVRDAPITEIREAIRPGGLVQGKSVAIKSALEASTPDAAAEPDLGWLEEAPREKAIDFLVSLPGVGRKTAACVLIFSYDRPEIPVDVHVYRVGGRLGLFPERLNADRAHDEMRAIVDPEDAYELHMNLIAHGREVCRPRPLCAQCGLRRMCPWYRRNRGSTGRGS